MRSKRIVGALTALILAVQLAALAEPSSATQACSAGGNPAPWAAEYEDEVEHLGHDRREAQNLIASLQGFEYRSGQHAMPRMRVLIGRLIYI